MRILIEVPTYDGRIARCTSESLWRLDRGGHVLDYKPRQGYGCAMARNRIAADSLDAGYDYVMMVDNDIELPRDALVNLLSHDADIVLGYYLNRYARGGGKLTCLFKDGVPGWEMWPADGLKELAARGEHLVPVKAGGLGCALFRTSVFRRMEFPWFAWTDLSREPYAAEDVYGCSDRFTSGGEDVNFCNEARALGIDVLADTRVACGHEFREVVWP